MEEQKIGKYTLIRQIATGGMAEIWLAEQRGPGGFNKEMVIKRILPHLATEGQMTEMFMDEARTVAQLSHPNIAQVFELGEHDGEYFIAMEFIDGFDLSDLREELSQRGALLPVNYATRMVCDMLAALDYAHEFVDRDGNHVGLIHRDISPHNVLISNDGTIKLVDFGVAKASKNTHKTESGAVKGKFAYMAPEQIENNKLDRRVDIFATGALFYELLTGEKPFGDDLKAVSLIISVDAKDPRELRPDIPEEVAQIILRALSRDRNQRYSTAAEMEQALRDYLRDAESVVGTRELSVMVRQLRDVPASNPTQQLFGFEKQGVEKRKPRITTRDLETNEPAKAEIDPQIRTDGAATLAPLTAADSEKTKNPTQREIPSAKGNRNTLAMKAQVQSESEGVSLKLVAGFIVLTIGIVAVFAVAAILFITSGNDEVVGSNGDETAVVTDQDQTSGSTDPVAEERQARWRHGDGGLIISIVTDRPAELYHQGEMVGTTPFQTSLRPGTYEVEFRAEGANRVVEFEVEADRPIQNYRFDL